MSIFNVFWVINIISLQVFLANSYCTKSLVPALYVFGDSTVDAGNNNNLNTDAKVNRFPYGIDFNNVSTGRFSNGKTFADILAIKLGLPMPPPYLGVSTTERYQIASGINYASGSCGILIPLKNLVRFTNTWDSCVGEGGKPCENRNEYYFYDFAHSTEATIQIYANKCFSGRHLCFPLNIEKLAHTH
ncbi:hypothetical protein P8452_19328 [Trifolium repens]|nr:hypothetical protein P8452_19328 [Trifolium repens]